jgi:hypothetical protein
MRTEFWLESLKDRWWVLVNTVKNHTCSIKGREFLDYPSTISFPSRTLLQGVILAIIKLHASRLRQNRTALLHEQGTQTVSVEMNVTRDFFPRTCRNIFISYTINETFVQLHSFVNKRTFTIYFLHLFVILINVTFLCISIYYYSPRR